MNLKEDIDLTKEQLSLLLFVVVCATCAACFILALVVTNRTPVASNVVSLDRYAGVTNQVRVDRKNDGGYVMFAKPVPGGCVYTISNTAPTATNGYSGRNYVCSFSLPS
jgi:hypothetical protein